MAQVRGPDHGSGLRPGRSLPPAGAAVLAAGRLLASLIVVALIVFAFGIGTSYDFTTSGLIPTAVVTSAITIGLVRAAYESVSLEVLRAAGIRRRVVLVGEGESLNRLRGALAASQGRHRLRVRRSRRHGARSRPPPARLARRPGARSRRGPPRRGDPLGGRLRRTDGARRRRAGAPQGDQGAAGAGHDRAARAARRVRPRPRDAAVRAPAARAHGLGLGDQARVRPRSEPARRAAPAPALAPHRPGGEARLARPRLLRRPARRRGRA